MILGRCRNLKMAFIASENVLSGGAGDRIEARSPCFIDPTSGALEMSVDLRLNLRTALSREVGCTPRRQAGVPIAIVALSSACGARLPAGAPLLASPLEFRAPDVKR